jgi:hypothetical protein
VNAERRSERLVLNFSASRSIQPSSLGTLLTEDDVSLGASFPWTERLTLGATAHGTRLSDSLQRLNTLSGSRYYSLGLNASWLCAEHWTLALQSSYNLQHVEVQTLQGSGVTLSLTLTRQLGRIRL